MKLQGGWYVVPGPGLRSESKDTFKVKDLLVPRISSNLI